MSRANPSCLMVSPSRKLINSSISAQTGAILSIPRSCACNPAFGCHKVASKGHGLLGGDAFDSGFETWPVRDVNGRMLAIFDNDYTHRILHVSRRCCVPNVEVRRNLCRTCLPGKLVKRRLCRFGHAARRPEYELIGDLLLQTPLHMSQAKRRPTPSWTTSLDRESSDVHDRERIG